MATSYDNNCNQCCRHISSNWTYCPSCGSRLKKPDRCPTCCQELPKNEHVVIEGWVSSVQPGEVSYIGPSWSGFFITFNSEHLAYPHDVRVTPENLSAIEYSLEHGTRLRAKLIPKRYKPGVDRHFSPCYGTRRSDPIRVQVEPSQIESFEDFQIVSFC